ncbi:hypothetical protein ABK040_000921 [Willaertia magna]
MQLFISFKENDSDTLIDMEIGNESNLILKDINSLNDQEPTIKEGLENAGVVLFTDKIPLFHSEDIDKLTLKVYGIKHKDNLFAFFIDESLSQHMYELDLETENAFLINRYWKPTNVGDNISFRYKW